MPAIFRNSKYYGANNQINDVQTSANTTWSSEKIDNTKADKIKSITLTQNTGSGSVVDLGDNINNKKPLAVYSPGYKLELYVAASGNVFFDVRQPNNDNAVLNTSVTFTVLYI